MALPKIHCSNLNTRNLNIRFLTALQIIHMFYDVLQGTELYNPCLLHSKLISQHTFAVFQQYFFI